VTVTVQLLRYRLLPSVDRKPAPMMYKLLVIFLFACLIDGNEGFNPPSPAARALQTALDAAIAAGDTTFVLPAGSTFFGNSSFNITNPGVMTISGVNSTILIFEPGSGVNVTDARSTTLSNFSIDYDPLPFVFGPVTAVNSSSFVVELDPLSLTFNDLKTLYPPHDTWPRPAIFSANTGNLVTPVCSWGSPPPATPLGKPRTFSIACSGRSVPLNGSIFAAATRIGITLSLSRCANVVVKDINILAAGYMAITEFQGDGANIYQRVKVAPPSLNRPVGSNADGFHSSGAAVGPTLDRVVIRNLLDDFFNVHTTSQLYIGPSWDGASSYLIGDYQLFAGDNSNYGTQTTLDRVRMGETISFYPMNTFSYPPLSSNTIASIVQVNGAAADSLLASAYKAASAAAVATPCSACRAGLNPFTNAQLWNITFTVPLVSVPPLSFATADAISAAGALITDCVFANSGSNLGRWKSSNGRIQRTVWQRTLSQNLEIEPLQNWLEGPFGIHNVTIDSCIFHGTDVSPVHTFGATNVILINNSFLPSSTL
jgi:hypothetical protein